MRERKQVVLARMAAGQSGTIVQVEGGRGLVNRLDALGIRAGRRITKISSMFMRGPITVAVGRTQVAIGFGMAARIIVELDKATE